MTNICTLCEFARCTGALSPASVLLMSTNAGPCQCEVERDMLDLALGSLQNYLHNCKCSWPHIPGTILSIQADTTENEMESLAMNYKATHKSVRRIPQM